MTMQAIIWLTCPITSDADLKPILVCNLMHAADGYATVSLDGGGTLSCSYDNLISADDVQGYLDLLLLNTEVSDLRF